MAKVIKLKTHKPPVNSSSGSGKRPFPGSSKGPLKKKGNNFRKDNRNASQKDNRFDSRHSKGGGASGSGRDKNKKDSKGESSDLNARKLGLSLQMIKRFCPLYPRVIACSLSLALHLLHIMVLILLVMRL